MFIVVQWSPFQNVEVPSHEELPCPKVHLSQQYPLDGGHHLASAAALQPSSPFILVTPPVYQQHQQYRQTGQAPIMGGEVYSSKPPNQQAQALYGQQQQHQHHQAHATTVTDNTGNTEAVVGCGSIPPHSMNPFHVCFCVPNPP